MLGCHTLYTEGLNHGQDYEGVRVINPFALNALEQEYAGKAYTIDCAG